MGGRIRAPFIATMVLRPCLPLWFFDTIGTRLFSRPRLRSLQPRTSLLTGFIDARTLDARSVLEPDLAIIGGGPAGISLALALADTKLNILLLESGGFNFDPHNQKLYAGTQSGRSYIALDAGRLRLLGGSTNHWGGWCRPLDAIDFERRDWMPHSGWPFPKSALDAYYP